jgi:hypothetical protein
MTGDASPRVSLWLTGLRQTIEQPQSEQVPTCVRLAASLACELESSAAGC